MRLVRALDILIENAENAESFAGDDRLREAIDVGKELREICEDAILGPRKTLSPGTVADIVELLEPR